MKAMEVLRLEKDEIDRDRRQLLLWNQELQKRLDEYSGQMPSAKIAEMQNKAKGDEKKRVSERFEHQLASLRKVLSHGQGASGSGSRSGSGSLNDMLIMKDIKHKIDENGSDISAISDLSDLVDEAVDHRRESAAQIHEHKVRAQQTAMIMYNLQNKLSKLPTLNETESQDLVDAAITSIRCLLDSTTRLTADTDSLKSQRRLTADEVAEIDGLKGENEKLIKKLADMKTTWIAHLDMLMAPHSAVVDEECIDDMRVSSIASLRMSVDSPGPSPRGSGAGKQRQSIFTKFGRKSKSNKIIKPIHGRAHSVVKGGYRSLLHAETDTKSPLFQVALSGVVSVLRIEEVLSAMTVTSPSNTVHNSTFDKTGMYIISTTEQKFVFKAEGNLSREVWMDNVTSLLSD